MPAKKQNPKSCATLAEMMRRLAADIDLWADAPAEAGSVWVPARIRRFGRVVMKIVLGLEAQDQDAFAGRVERGYASTSRQADQYEEMCVLRAGRPVEREAKARMAKDSCRDFAVLLRAIADALPVGGAAQIEPDADALKDEHTDPAEPKDVLHGSSAILAALGANTGEADWRKVKRLADRCGGPIRYRGNRPYAVRSELITWWNRVHEGAEQAERERANRDTTKAILNGKLKSPNPHHAGHAAEDLGLAVNSPAFRRRGK